MNQTKFVLRWTVLLTVFALLLVNMTAIAQDVTLGETVEATFTGTDTPYAVTVRAGQLLIVTMESEDFNTKINLLNGDVQVASDDNGGSGTNSVLAYAAQEDGKFSVMASASFFNIDSGTYTITVNVVDPVVLAIDSPSVLTPEAEGSNQLYAVFTAAAGDVVDVWAGTVGTEEEDVRVELYDINAVSIEIDLDDGPDNDALLRRVVLPADGIYLIKVDNERSDTPLLEGVEVTVNSTEQLFLSPDAQDLVLGDGEGHHGTEVYTIDVEAGVTYTFFMTIESMPDDTSGVALELLDTDFFFEPELDTMHMTAVAWSWLSNTTGQIRLDIHPTFFGTDIEAINYTISMEIDG